MKEALQFVGETLPCVGWELIVETGLEWMLEWKTIQIWDWESLQRLGQTTGIAEQLTHGNGENNRD
jgi:hypothetical protein